ncbi:hypothetical protein [Caudoviricetes sp.]|nr:hypothetical protein [Caudoviricetes sp.]
MTQKTTIDNLRNQICNIRTQLCELEKIIRNLQFEDAHQFWNTPELTDFDRAWIVNKADENYGRPYLGGYSFEPNLKRNYPDFLNRPEHNDTIAIWHIPKDYRSRSNWHYFDKIEYRFMEKLIELYFPLEEIGLSKLRIDQHNYHNVFDRRIRADVIEEENYETERDYLIAYLIIKDSFVQQILRKINGDKIKSLIYNLHVSEEAVFYGMLFNGTRTIDEAFPNDENNSTIP